MKIIIVPIVTRTHAHHCVGLLLRGAVEWAVRWISLPEHRYTGYLRYLSRSSPSVMRCNIRRDWAADEVVSKTH